jgi:hypothetical protein
MPSTPAQKSQAKALVAAFRGRSANVVWFNVQRAQLADDLEARIDSPEKISQNDTMWCGYASILFRAADQDPEGYAKFVIDLFEGGKASLNMAGPGSAEPVEADESIRTGDLPRFLDNNGKLSSLMPQADYVGLASLRKHFRTTAAAVVEWFKVLNWLDDIHGSQGGELCDALKKLGYQHTYDQSSVFSTRDLGYLNAASGHVDQNHVVSMLIDASLLKKPFAYYADGSGGANGDNMNKGRGNHWVALTSPVTYSPDKKSAKFTVFSWGRKYTVDTSVDVVQARFFGYVTAY